MLRMNYKLAELEEKNAPIMTSIIGAGQMGRGMTSQMIRMKGMKPAVVADINIDNVVAAFENSGLTKDDYIITNKLSEANTYLEKGKYIATENSEIGAKANLIAAAVDATGVPEVGAKVAIDSINEGKHICMLNVETDVVIGPMLKKLADNAGVIYTGSAGDEPGAVKELYDFATAAGFDVRVIGKGKNNAIDLDANPTSLAEYAAKRGVSPKMQTAFTDGTKTMVELTAMANSTGFIPDIRGGHGPEAEVKDLPNLFRPTSEGGILENGYGKVEWVNGIAPGVFVIISSDLPFVKHEMNYLSMGEGPNWVLYRPYHLCSLETPLTVAKAVLDNISTLVPMDGGLVCETVAVAKKDLKAGDMLDGIGGYTVYGTVDTHQNMLNDNAVPLGVITKNTKLVKDVKKGQTITYDMVSLDDNSLIVQLRKLQDRFFG